MKEVDRLHRVSKIVVSDRYPKFTSNFWKGFFKGFRTNLNLSTSIIQSQMGKQKGLIG
jgi:hypothetical protein